MYEFSMTEEQQLLLESVDQFIEQCKAEPTAFNPEY